MLNYEGHTTWEPFVLLARILEFDDVWLGRRIGAVNKNIEVLLTRVDGQLVQAITTPQPMNFHFPYGWVVEPDVP